MQILCCLYKDVSIYGFEFPRVSWNCLHGYQGAPGKVLTLYLPMKECHYPPDTPALTHRPHLVREGWGMLTKIFLAIYKEEEISQIRFGFFDLELLLCFYASCGIQDHLSLTPEQN